MYNNVDMISETYEDRVIDLHFCRWQLGSMLLFTFLKFKRSGSTKCWTKTDFKMKWLLKFILGHSFCNHSQANKGPSSYNTAGHISEVSEEVDTQIAKNCCRRQPHSHLMPPPRGTTANVRMHLIFPETRVIGLHFYCW